LGIVLPKDYGKFRVNGKLEVSLTEYNSEFFSRLLANFLKLTCTAVHWLGKKI
jgi:hypothetical protein